MALVWSRETEDARYELRSAGASLRLYRNGVNHSQWNPNRPLAGCIWDLITLPALYRKPGSVQDVLILGFGAGSVGRQLRELVGPKRIVGLDLDPVHLSLAERFFECRDGFELVEADAVQWIQECKAEAAYDMIVDDLYGEADDVPERYAPLGPDWCRALARLVKPGGMLVFNLVEPGKVKSLPPMVDEGLRDRFSNRRVFRIEGYENRVVVFSEKRLEPGCFREALSAICRRFPRCVGVEKRYRSAYLPAAS